MPKKLLKVSSRVGFIEPMHDEIKGPNRVSWFFSRLTDHWLAPNMRCDVRIPSPAEERARYALTFAPGTIYVRAATLNTHRVVERVYESPCEKEPLEFWHERHHVLAKYLMRGYGFPEDQENASLIHPLTVEQLESTYDASGNLTLVFGQGNLLVESWPGDQRQTPKLLSVTHGLTWRGASQHGRWETARTLHHDARYLACPWPLTGKEL